MRLSTETNDSGFCADARDYDVFLDGNKLKNVVTADEEKEFAIILRIGNGNYERHTLSGRVSIAPRASRANACMQPPSV
jgi:hypothetical protein